MRAGQKTNNQRERQSMQCFDGTFCAYSQRQLCFITRSAYTQAEIRLRDGIKSSDVWSEVLFLEAFVNQEILDFRFRVIKVIVSWLGEIGYDNIHYRTTHHEPSEAKYHALFMARDGVGREKKIRVDFEGDLAVVFLPK